MSIFYIRKKLFLKTLLILVSIFFITTIAYALEDWHRIKKDSNFKLKIAAPAELLVKEFEDPYQTNKKFLIPAEHSFLMTTEQTDRIVFEQELNLKAQNDKTTFSKGQNAKLDVDYFFDPDVNDKLKNFFDVQIFWKYTDSTKSFTNYDNKNKPSIIDQNGNLKKIIIQFVVSAIKVLPTKFQTKEKPIYIKYNIEKTL
jgi:hypothetical protein